MGKECINFKGGRCKVALNSNTPSLAEIRKTKDGTEVLIDTTDPNLMANFYGLVLQKPTPRPLPPRLVVTQPKYTEFLVCTASNCKSKQKECSHFSIT